MMRDYPLTTELAVARFIDASLPEAEDWDREPDDPTPAEIAEACRRIRAGWSESVRDNRLVVGRTIFSMKAIEIRSLRRSTDFTDSDANRRSDAA